jgi:hypothetical protein
MEGPYVSRRAYMYGNTFFEYPVPYYNSTLCHCPKMRPPYRPFPEPPVGEDPESYLPYPETDMPDIGIVRPDPKYMILNIETSLIKTLKVTIYGAKEEDDKTIIMEIGKRYAVTYMTQTGLKTADGYLRYISDSIPDECTRYIDPSTPEVLLQSFIGMDCSTKGISDKRKIYIASIRGIEELADDEDYVAPADKDNTITALYGVLLALKNATDALTTLNESDICLRVLNGINDIKEDVNVILDKLEPPIDDGNEDTPTEPSEPDPDNG